MANTIKIKNSSTANAVPSTLEYGEIAINYTDGKIFYKNNANTIVSLASSIRVDDLLDVVTTAPVAGQILSYNGTNWVNVENFSEAIKHIVKNDSGVTLAAGTAVYTSGSNGTNILVKQAQANTETTSATVIGLLATSLVANANGYVITQGLIAGINTSVAVAGDPVWLSPTTPGGITFGLANKPAAPNHLVYMGVVTRSHATNGEIFVHILNGWELEELHNVSISSVQSGDFLKYNGSIWINGPITLGTDTSGNYMSGVTAGTGVTVTHTPGEGSNATIAIGQAVGTTDNPTFAGATIDSVRVGITASNEIDTTSGNLIIDSTGGTTTIDDNLIITGNLTVSGTTTTVNTATVNIADNIITLNSDYTTGAPTENAGVEVLRGTSATVSLRWNETNDKWESTNDGTTYGNIVTTADSGTITSTMISDGTIVNADINTSAAIAHSKLANATAGQVLLGTTTTGVITATTLSGDVTITGGGVTTISSNVIVDADINTSAAISHSKLASITAGSILLGNSTNVPTATAVTGDVTISSSGVTAIASNVIINADININANIALTKLAPGSSGQIILGNATGIPTYTSVTGDVTITNAGVTAISSNSIIDADINTAAGISLSKLASGTAGQIVMANATGIPTYTAISGDFTLSSSGVATLGANISQQISDLYVLAYMEIS